MPLRMALFQRSVCKLLEKGELIITEILTYLFAAVDGWMPLDLSKTRMPLERYYDRYKQSCLQPYILFIIFIYQHELH